jgi:outer membrane receptor for ferrienterochelin and colicins
MVIWLVSAGTLGLAAEVSEPNQGYFEMSLEDLMKVNVVSATLREQSPMNAPSPIYVVTAQEIRERGYHTLKEVMDDVPGFVDLSDTNENIAGVRGAYASTTNKILILVDGHRMNNFSLGRYNTDQFMGMDTVERIEFVMGPGSVLYGTGALLGVVNVITKKGADQKGLFVQGTAGSFQNEGSASWGQKSNDLDVFANFTYLDGDGETIRQPAALDVVPAGQTKESGDVYWNRYPQNWNALVSASNEDSTLHVRRGHYFRASPRAANGSFYDYDQEQSNGFPVGYQQDDFYIDAAHVFTFDDDSKLTVNPSFDYINLKEQSWISQYGANRLPPLGSRSGQNSEEVHWNFKSYYERDLTESLSSLVGIDAHYIDFQRADALELRNGDTYTVTPGRTDLGQWPLWGAFGELTWKPLPKWALTGGLRFDDFGDQADSMVTPRLAAVYRPMDYWSLKLIYGESYLSPQWEHTRINSDNFSFASNPDLSPEKMRSMDFIAQYQNPMQKLGGWVDVFVNKVDDIITPITVAGQQTYVNLGTSEYWGVETGLQQDVLPTVRLTGSYSLVHYAGESDAQFIQDGEIKNVPRHIFRYGVRWQPLDKLVLNLWGRTATSSQVSDSVTGNTTLDGWTQLDFTATYSIKRFEIRGKIINLLDEDYEVGGTVTRPLPRYGRGFELSLGYYF